MKNFRLFTVKFSYKFVPKVIITDHRFDTIVSIPFDHSTDTKGTALKYFSSRGINILGMAEGKDFYAFFSDNFELPLK